MKLFIKADMEGISGIVREEQVTPGTKPYKAAQEYYTRDLNAIVEGAVEAGVDDVVIYDMHWDGINILTEKIHERASCILGKPVTSYEPYTGMSEDLAGFILAGFHAMAGTNNSLLAHSYEDFVKTIRINGVQVGEIGMEAALAGHYGVPLIMVSGDSKGARETEELLDDVVTVTTKKSLGYECGLCYHHSKTEKKLKEGAKKAVGKREQINPYIVDTPVKLEIEMRTTMQAEKIGFGHEGNKIALEEDSVLEAWTKFREAVHRTGLA